MMPSPFVYRAAAVVVASSIVAGTTTADPPDPSWSAPVNGLQARVTLVEKDKFNGTRVLVPYLELRNVSERAVPMQVRCERKHVTFELVEADGKALPDRDGRVRDGIPPRPGTVSLPFDSEIRVNMYCTNWGVPKDRAAMIGTDSGAWVIHPEEKGKVSLRVTIRGDRPDSHLDPTWYGTIKAEAKVDWKD